MKPVIHVISGAALSRSFALQEGEQIIGRDNTAQIQIPSKEISRQHAKIMVSGSSISITDLQSSNGTIVNGKRVNASSLKHKDRIILGDVILEFRDESKFSPQKLDAGKTLVHQATKIMTERLKPKNLWPFFFMFFAISFLLISWITHSSYHSLLEDRLTKQSLVNAQNLVRYLAEKNRQDLQLQNHLLLDVTSVETEKGVIEARIISNTGRVLAPARSMDQTDQGPYVMEALNHASNEVILPSPKDTRGFYTLVHPIRVYDDRQGKYVILGVAKILFDTKKAVGPLPETKQLFYVMIFLSLLISVGMSWVATKSLSQPILHLAEKIQRWRTGQVYQNEDAPFKDWDPLYQAVQRAIEDIEK
ncbi:MAG: FHA domain-containing protein [Bdellovibrionales bacterium]|nr:FHA domain-containing protein [Bdellovibrionales bacterium]